MKTCSYPCAFTCLRFFALLLIVVCVSEQVRGDTLTVNGASQPNFDPLPWSVSAPIPPFNISYARLQQVSYSLYAGAEVHQFFSNPSGFNDYENVNGTATVDLSSGG